MTILSIVDFAKNYTFVPQNEIHSEYYHSDQVSMLFHILYRHAKQNVYHIESTNENRHVIKEYHFYINDDRKHDTHFIQHCFEKIYDSLKCRGIKLMKIGYGQMDGQVNSNIHDHYFGCVIFI